MFAGKNPAAAEGRENENGPKVVEIIRYVVGQSEPVIFVRCELAKGEVSLTGVEENKNPEELAGVQNILRSLEVTGVFSAALGKNVYPKDGQKFLEALLQNYDHPYLLARVTR